MVRPCVCRRNVYLPLGKFGGWQASVGHAVLYTTAFGIVKWGFVRNLAGCGVIGGGVFGVNVW